MPTGRSHLLITALRGVTVLAALGLAASLPAAWLAWEGQAAQAQADLVMQAAQARAETGLRGLFGGFERATGSLRPDLLSGDSVALTARLLLLEPMAAPARGLEVLDAKGMRLAGASVGASVGAAPVWWAQGVGTLPARQAGVLGCGGWAPAGAGFVLARAVTDADGQIQGAVGGVLAEGVLTDLAAPAGIGAAAITGVLQDGSGCVYAQHAAAASDTGAALPLAGAVRAVLGAAWGVPAGASGSVAVGNLVWRGTISPEAALALRGAEMARHGVLVRTLTLALAGLVLMLFGMSRLGARRDETPAADLAEAAPIDVIDAPNPLEGCRAMVVGLADRQRRDVAGHLRDAGLAVALAPDALLALALVERAAQDHEALDLMVLDAAPGGMSAETFLARLRGLVDFDRLRVVLVANGAVAGTLGGPVGGTAALDALVAGLFAPGAAVARRGVAAEV